jgi:hypothetical protein
MQPYKKQLLRRNAWYRQQLQSQQTTHNANQNQSTQPATLAGTATTQATSSKH